MLKNKFILALLLLLGTNSVYAINLDDVNAPMPLANRLGVGAEPEHSFKISTSNTKTASKDASLDKSTEAVKSLTYADLSLKKIAKELADDGALESDEVLKDVQLLWVGAAQNSETVKFIVYKLSNPDEDKPNDSIVKKIIRPISTVGSLAGIGMGSPIAAVSSIMGSSVLGSMSVDDKDLNYKFSKVNDADMIVLIRKIEELQRKIINYYMDYMTAREGLMRSDELVNKRRIAFVNSKGYTDDQILMLDSFYRSALNKQSKLKSEFLARRAALEQVVGVDTLVQFEDILTKREADNKK